MTGMAYGGETVELEEREALTELGELEALGEGNGCSASGGTIWQS